MQSTPTAGTKTATRWELLALLRFCLALIVLCEHIARFYPDADPITRGIGSLGGKAAVIGFMLVSGFSIASSIDARRQGFYRRRLFRVYPLYACAVVLALIVEGVSGGAIVMPSAEVIRGTALTVGMANLLFLQMFIVPAISFDGPVWSLSLEMSYYSLAPLLTNYSYRWLLLGILISAIAYILPRHDEWGALYKTLTHINALIWIWPWLIGFLMYRKATAPRALLLLGIGLMVLKQDESARILPVTTFIVAFGTLWFAAKGAPGARTKSIAQKTMLYLGDLSYPLYLFHFPLILGSTYLGYTNHFSVMIIAAAGSVFALHLIDIYLKRQIEGLLPAASLPPIPSRADPASEAHQAGGRAPGPLIGASPSPDAT